ncbi:MASE3 domain-containing protein [Spirochaeta isovalerica]|uniref:histidine kinase n=1 Tax=Spirochaeta isovalerica TaxID=150 RepID=A0A841R747_9SPIO|nr:MASE3 domain-containing protein [Spirochaeta isovalerica]MBB6479665.1 PAS domain S-box-containing protein [Spirochaeta isovalerica]
MLGLTGLLRFYSFLLFHSVVEFISILIAFSIFIIAWNTRGIAYSGYLVFLGIAYLFIGSLDLLHTLAYKGMNVFPGYDSDLPTQLWIAARYTESLSMLISPLFISRKNREYPVLFAFSLFFIFVLLSLFRWDLFPACYIEGVGLTYFKKVSEYVISLILVLAVLSLSLKRHLLKKEVYVSIVMSLLLSILSEIMFTFYIGVYDISNLIGHIFKLISVYFLYKAMIVMTLTDPLETLFAEIHKREKNFRELIELSPVPMLVVSAEDKNVEVLNRKFTEIFGYSEKDLVTLDQWWEALCPDREYRERVREAILEEAALAREDGRDTPVRELLMTGKNGVIHHCNFYIVFLGSYSLSIFHDITDRKRLEQERRALSDIYVKNDKMMALGRLAAGTAHEINNPLAGMMQSIYVLNSRLMCYTDNVSNHKAAEESGTDCTVIRQYMEKRGISSLIDNITSGGLRISNIVENLHYFARDEKGDRSWEEPHELLENAIRIADTDPDFQKIRKNIQIEDNLPDLFCVRDRIQQVLLNIFRNGTQAMTENITEDPVFDINMKSSKDKRHLILSIGDNGPGMAYEVKRMIFEPFYTTREVGAGTGLGLSVSYFIINEGHKGTISVDSYPGRGAHFIITLPFDGEEGLLSIKSAQN